MTVVSETRERFLRTIVAKVPPEGIAEVHFFQPMKQGGVESGVAVVAAEERKEALEPALDGSTESATTESAAEAAEERGADTTTDAEALSSKGESVDSAQQFDADAAEEVPQPRYTVYTAFYRLTLKGPDRGKWTADVVAEAEAPLITVDAVVRGVQRRAGDVEEPERMSGDELRALLGSTPPKPNGQAA